MLTDSRFLPGFLELVLAPKWAKAVLAGFVLIVHLVANVLYFQTYGAWSSSSMDIWSFINVAKGCDHLLWGNPLQWILFLLGFLPAGAIFWLLVILSNVLHFAALFVLYHALRDFHLDDWAALWGCAVFSCLYSSMLFCTGALYPQQVSLPILIGLLWAGHRFLIGETEEVKRRMAEVMVLLILDGLCIGPEVMVVSLVAGPCIVSWYLRRFFDPFIRHLMGTMLLILYFVTLYLAAPYLKDLTFLVAHAIRGINLAGQQEMDGGGLSGMKWMDLFETYSVLHVVVLLLAFWAWLRMRLPELAVLFAGIVFTLVSARFFFIMDLGIAVMIAWVIGRVFRGDALMRHITGFLAVFLFLGSAVWHGVPCAYPGMLYSTLETIKKEIPSEKLVLCTPTYGFLVRAAAGARPTSDMNHLNQKWVEMASRPAEESIAALKQLGITHIFLTSHDCNRVMKKGSHDYLEAVTAGTGGFGSTLPQLSDQELSETLVHRVLFGRTPVAGTTVLQTQIDSATEQKAVLLRVD